MSLTIAEVAQVGTGDARVVATRRLLQFFGNLNEGDRFSLAEFAAAIESEAVEAERSRILTALSAQTGAVSKGFEAETWVSLALVLAIVEPVP